MSGNDPPDEEYWVFVFGRNFNEEEMVWTRNVETGVQTVSSDAERAKEITLVADLDEAVHIKETLTHLGSATVKNAIDGRDIVEDSSIDERSTVRVLPPESRGDSFLPAGRYIVEAFAIIFLNPAYFEVELALARKDGAAIGGFGFDFGHNFGLRPENPREVIDRP